MDPSELLVLAEAVVVFPISEIDPVKRASIDASDGDYGLTKNDSRRTTRLIDRTAAELLEEFRKPTSVPDAIVRFSRKFDADPSAVMVDSFEFLDGMVRDGFLMLASATADSRFGPLETTGGWRMLEPLRLLDDTEVLLVLSAQEQRGVLKRVAPDADAWVRAALANEARVLGALQGNGAPLLLEDGHAARVPYIVVEWRSGLPSPAASMQLRRPWLPESRQRLAAICVRILDAYALLHERGIIHGDVHPGNVLIDLDTDAVSLIDFGLAVDTQGKSAHVPPRGGIEAFHPPERARALLDGKSPPEPTAGSEQYAVAALLYRLLAGQDYIEQLLDRKVWHEAICTQPPRPFMRLGLPPWPALEAVLARALAKDPADRYPSVAAFRDAFAAAGATGAGEASSTQGAWQAPCVFDNAIARLADPADATDRPLQRPTANINHGATGIAYFLLRASGMLNRPDLFAAADLWIERAKRDAAIPDDAFYDESRGLNVNTVGRTALYHSALGMHCVDALIACSAEQPDRLATAIDAFIAAATIPEDRADVTTGYAGHLIACATLLDAMAAANQFEERERLIALGQRRKADLLAVWGPLDKVLPGAREPYYGIAHGWAGAAYAMLRHADATGEPVPEAVVETLRELAAVARRTRDGAHWPMGVRNEEVWTSWCHGTAGYALLWSLAQRILPDGDFAELAILAGEHAWNTRAPDTGHLCCGAAGQGYAFLALHRLTGDGKYVDRARQRLEHGVGFVGTRGMTTDSLYKGDLGLALLECELAEPSMAAMPMFEGERWS
jgi:serine/threonine-protein kinase